ncbi:Hint domain-containing protein [Palleronia sp.]|uniref:Hint domain-containing protein n=1 Tax=Palleronia sp. TaxID=1940284 RepID=UPI0035C855F7
MSKIATDRQGLKRQTGLATGTRVMTLDGPLPVEFLQPGDRIVTRHGVRHLRDVRVTVRRKAQAVTIRASALGHHRPEADVTVAADHQILVRGWRAKALYGSDQATVPAAKLVDGEYISLHMVDELRSFDLIFDEPQVIYADGTEIAVTTTTVTSA